MWPCTFGSESQQEHTQDSRNPHCVTKAMHGLSVWDMARFMDNWASMSICTRFSLDDEKCSWRKGKKIGRKMADIICSLRGLK